MLEVRQEPRIYQEVRPVQDLHQGAGKQGRDPGVEEKQLVINTYNFTNINFNFLL